MRMLVVMSYLFFLTATDSFALQSDSNSSTTTDSGYINIEGGKLWYEIAGEGGNIVLLHDGLIHREVWDDVFLVLARNHRVLRYDRRGYGKSSSPQVPFSNVNDLDQLLVQLEIEKAIILGMSSGGGIAIDFTLEYPEKVTALVLVGAVVSGYGYSSHMLTRGGRISSVAELLSDPQRFMKYIAMEDPYEIHSDHIKAKEKCLALLEANPQNVNMDKGRFQKPPARPAIQYLSEIKIPTLILVGEYDIPDVHAHAGAINAGIANSKRDVIPQSGHLIPLEQPALFNDAVNKFLNDLSN
jgi:pimeloyl-ACP methyl ester carboxylesterase